MLAGDGGTEPRRPFAGPQQVLAYLGRYTHRIAISDNRRLSVEEGKVRFRWKGYRNGDRTGIMTLSAEEFIRRFSRAASRHGNSNLRSKTAGTYVTPFCSAVPPTDYRDIQCYRISAYRPD
jgi:hypothetical protein